MRIDDIECSGEGLQESQWELKEEADADRTSGVKVVSEPNNQRLEDFFPRALMLLVRLFRLADPNIRHCWILWVALFLGSAIDWPFHLIRLLVGLKPNISEAAGSEGAWWFHQIVWTIWGVVLVDFYESMRKYLSHDVFFLLGEHVDVCQLRWRINCVVFLGIFSSLSLGVIVLGIYVPYWQRMHLFDRIVFPLRLICWETSWLIIYSILPGGTWVLCELLKSNIHCVSNPVMEVIENGADHNLQDLQKASCELNSRLVKFSHAFQRPLVSIITFYVMGLFTYDLGSVIWLIFFMLEIVQLVILLHAISLPSVSVANFIRTINENFTENDEILPFKKLVGFVKLCGIRVTQPRIWAFLFVFVVLPTILNIVLTLIE